MIYVVEPHADDACLSMGGHIERWTKEGTHVIIVTVYSGTRKRGREAEAYAKAVRADWVGLGYEEGGSKNPTRLPDGVFHMRGLFKQGCPVYGPVGFQHPEHREVYRHLPEWACFYLDMPYAMKQKNSEAITQMTRGFEIVSYLRPPARKYRHCSIFKDQALFFRYNPPEELKHSFELTLRRRP